MDIPNKYLLRRAEVVNAGISKYEVRKLIHANILTPIHLPCKNCEKKSSCTDKSKCKEKGRAFFSREQLINILKD